MLHVARIVAVSAIVSIGRPQATLDETEARANAVFADLPPISSDMEHPSGSGAYMARGAARFKRNMIAASCNDFDQARLPTATGPASGFSLYYQGRLADCRDQFAADVAGNPNDTEETIWHFACNARLRARTGYTCAAAAAARLEMLPVGRKLVGHGGCYHCFYGQGTVADLLATADGAATSSNAYTPPCQDCTRLMGRRARTKQWVATVGIW